MPLPIPRHPSAPVPRGDQPIVRRQAIYAPASLFEVPGLRQQNGTGLQTNPSVTLPQVPLLGSILLAWVTSEASSAKTVSGGGAQWFAVLTQNASSGMFCALWMGVVVGAPSASVTVTSAASTSGAIVAEFVGLKGKVHSQVSQQGGAAFAVPPKVGGQGITVGVSGHRGGTPGVPGTDGSSYWNKVHERNNDLSMFWTPTHLGQTLNVADVGSQQATAQVVLI